MTQEEFINTVNLGDIVTIYGVNNTVIPCIVMTKTSFACNLYTVEQSDKADGVMRPEGSYYRSYSEIIARIGEAKGLYDHYIDLRNRSNFDYFDEDEETRYKVWLDTNYKFIRRFIKECISIDVDKESDYYGSESYEGTIDIEIPSEFKI